MSRPHTAMRKIREVIRLSLGERLSLRQISSSLQIPTTTVREYVKRARDADLTWPLPSDLDDDSLDLLLFGSQTAPAQVRPMPDWAKIHLEPSPCHFDAALVGVQAGLPRWLRILAVLRVRRHGKLRLLTTLKTDPLQ